MPPGPRDYYVGFHRNLPTGTWLMVEAGVWRKLCHRCSGTGIVHSSIDSSRCWGCIQAGTGRPSGFEPGVKTRNDAEFDAKERADAKAADKAQVARSEAAEAYLALHAEERAAEEAEEARKEAELQCARDASRHLASPAGDKVTIAGKVVTAITLEVASYSPYGGVDQKRLIVMELEDGVKVKMFTTAAWAWQVERGMGATVAATVKKHGEYNGFKQTEVNRPKLVSSTPALEAPGL